MYVFDDPNSRAFGRTTGALYLTIAVAGGFAIAYVPSVLHVAGDAAATWSNILANRALFMTGILGDVIMMVAELFVTAMLYAMFRTTNPTLSLIAALSRLMMVAVMAAMLLFHAGGLHLAQGVPDIPPDLADAMAGVFLYMHDAGVWVWQIFFSVHLLVLGGLIIRSERAPLILGIGLTVGGMGYLLDSIYAFAFPMWDGLAMARAALLVVVTMSEIGFALWLLIVGAREVEHPSPALRHPQLG
ncbi:DUF4386 domain-containing protein [Shimia ponticola]|uniref:DUF4386 domain-containing protein n=1 Tax=Shimia ponticola TaxID=2582893 RepID=UPI0011BF4A20|nr:DUF4386 domain-containing protein [Shimia ponticola]